MGNGFEYRDTIDYKQLDKMGKLQDEILIGYPAGMIHNNPDGESSDMAEDARTLSFGADGIPARPFLEDGMESGKAEIQSAIEKHFKLLLESGKGNLQRIAVTAIAEIQRFVHGDTYKSSIPNSKSTIKTKSTRQKGKFLLSDTPLSDSGQMINGLTSVINGVKSGQ